MPGDRWQQLANLRAYLSFMWSHPGKQLLFMGCELGQDREWAEERDLDWWHLDDPQHAGLLRLVDDLNARYRDNPALWRLDSDPAGFRWIDANDANGNVFSWLRSDQDGNLLACVTNFSGSPHHGYTVGLPHTGRWTEVLNTDATTYGGSGEGNLGGVEATDTPSHGLPASARVMVPAMSAVWLRHDG
jgi:1,4-alpha-glucan branching enzyme